MTPRHLVCAAAVLALAPLAACVTPPAAMQASSETVALQECRQVTGSRIRTREQCEPVGYPFQSFSAEDLQGTGQIDLNQALRQLHPAFQ